MNPVNSVINWWKHPAKWYQFWLPQSSLIGGLIFGSVGIIFAIIIGYLISGIK